MLTSFAAFYNYTDNGNVSKSTFHNPQISLGANNNTYWYAYNYDTLNRLTKADYVRGGDSLNINAYDLRGLQYDAAGNITGLRRRKENGTWIDDLAYTYQPGTNKLSSLTDAVSATSESWDAEDVASFGYDPNGNLISQSGKFTNIDYDHRNLPTHFALDGGGDVRAFYNADGQRVLKEQSASSYRFYVMDGQQSLAVIKDGTLSHMNLVGNATFGRLDADGSGNITATSSSRRYYLIDHLGSTRAVANDSGTILETFDYYPFGLLMPKRSSTTGNTIEKFTGKERDEAIGLDYFGARYYDPAVPRFTSVDPLADNYPAWSPYNYTLGNPVNLIDPDGMAVEEIAGGVRYTGIDAQNFFRQLKSQYGGQSGSCPDPPCGGDEDDEEQQQEQKENNTATNAAMGMFTMDLATPEFTDGAWPKWALWAIVLGGAVIIDQTGYFKGYSLADTTFPDEGELARRLGVPRSKLHDKVKEIKDYFGSKNPDIGISEDGNIVLKDRKTGKEVDTGVPVEAFEE